jgi:hypothetical protein
MGAGEVSAKVPVHGRTGFVPSFTLEAPSHLCLDFALYMKNQLAEHDPLLACTIDGGDMLNRWHWLTPDERPS